MGGEISTNRNESDYFPPPNGMRPKGLPPTYNGGDGRFSK